MSTPLPMIDAESVSEALEKLEKGLAIFEAYRVPLNLSDAQSGGWDAVDGQLGFLFLQYKPETAAIDKRRMISVKKVLEVLAAYEEDLISQTCLQRPSLAWRAITSKFQTIRLVLTHLPEIWQFIKTLWNVDNLLSFLLKFLIDATALAAIHSLVTLSSSAALTWSDKMRAKALPQRKGKRYYRKRRTRT